jgi:hypothetical protein
VFSCSTVIQVFPLGQSRVRQFGIHALEVACLLASRPRGKTIERCISLLSKGKINR